MREISHKDILMSIWMDCRQEFDTEMKDDRVPVMRGSARDAQPGDLVLSLPAPVAHIFGCRCCGGRDPLATALSNAFIARARAKGPWFDRVLLLDNSPDPGRIAVVLETDLLSRARFRLLPTGSG